LLACGLWFAALASQRDALQEFMSVTRGNDWSLFRRELEQVSDTSAMSIPLQALAAALAVHMLSTHECSVGSSCFVVMLSGLLVHHQQHFCHVLLLPWSEPTGKDHA
jgi:hypothetical protein